MTTITIPRAVVEQALEALESIGQPIFALAPLIDAAAVLRAALEQEQAEPKRNEWQEALHDALTNVWALSAENQNDPRKAVADLIAAETRIALDPAVSLGAQALFEQGKDAARAAIAKAEGDSNGAV